MLSSRWNRMDDRFAPESGHRYAAPRLSAMYQRQTSTLDLSQRRLCGVHENRQALLLVTEQAWSELGLLCSLHAN